jgi:hypothetical protein
MCYKDMYVLVQIAINEYKNLFYLLAFYVYLDKYLFITIVCIVINQLINDFKGR